MQSKVIIRGYEDNFVIYYIEAEVTTLLIPSDFNFKNTPKTVFRTPNKNWELITFSNTELRHDYFAPPPQRWFVLGSTKDAPSFPLWPAPLYTTSSPLTRTIIPFNNTEATLFTPGTGSILFLDKAAHYPDTIQRNSIFKEMTDVIILPSTELEVIKTIRSALRPRYLITAANCSLSSLASNVLCVEENKIWEFVFSFDKNELILQ
ncbi:hypothetical protein QA601_05295 [Chitinispirillales bacterium ANBcel5]|uniref:hypothetical protein n=1 Tax=Cellulosispirillum alkaliphilum TaxID=3039283 RepID=UPI002A501AD8|nr:hypothetical protein [Chitinispirillales bacterium ANBcel5]